MKKLILAGSILCGLNAFSQNTIPTTTVTGALKINDSLRVNKNITAKGEVIVKDTLRAKKDVLVDGNVNIDGKLKVQGNAKFKDDVRLEKGFTFDGTSGLTRIMNGNNQIFRLGGGLPTTLGSLCAALPNSPITNQFGGLLQLYDPASASTNAVLNIQSFATQCSIDASIGSQVNSSAGLLINYFCQNDTKINVGGATNTDGGIVYMGPRVDMKNSLKIGYSGNPIDVNTSLEINQNGNNANAIKINTSNNVLNCFTIRNPNFVNSPFTVTGGGNTTINAGFQAIKYLTINDASGTGSPKESFVVFGNGKTQIGSDRVTTGPHTDAMLSVGGNGKVACKEVRVFNDGSGYWADFVFEKNYKLMSLLEVEKYYKQNKHLPNIPTAKQIEESGNDLAKTDALLLQKIEELTLYIVQQQKEIEALKTIVKKQ